MGRWRVGSKVGRTVYRDEKLVGMLDTPELAAELVNAANGMRSACDQCGDIIEPPTTAAFGPVFCRQKCASAWYARQVSPSGGEDK